MEFSFATSALSVSWGGLGGGETHVIDLLFILGMGEEGRERSLVLVMWGGVYCGVAKMASGDVGLPCSELSSNILDERQTGRGRQWTLVTLFFSFFFGCGYCEDWERDD